MAFAVARLYEAYLFNAVERHRIYARFVGVYDNPLVRNRVLALFQHAFVYEWRDEEIKGTPKCND
jgi:hypothetical protein